MKKGEVLDTPWPEGSADFYSYLYKWEGAIYETVKPY